MKTCSGSSTNLDKKIDFSLLKKLSKNISNTRNQLIFRLLLETSCTLHELISLEPNAFKFTDCHLFLGKKGKKRKIILPLELSLLLNKFLDKNKKFIFSSRQSEQLSPVRVEQIVKEISQKLVNKKLTPTDIRSLAIKHIFSKTKSLPKTKMITGIKNLKERVYLTKSQINKIRNNISKSQHLLIFEVLYETGCKLKELINLKLSDINFKDLTLTIKSDYTQYNKKRTFSISKKLSLQIKEFVLENNLSQNEFLFSTRQSPQISDKRVFQILKKYTKLAGISASPRIIRNTSIAHSLQANKPKSEIKAKYGIQSLDYDRFGLFKKKIKKNE